MLPHSSIRLQARLLRAWIWSQIHSYMQKTWHSAEHPLKLGPAHIAGDLAVADRWHQGKGGRAVFKRSNKQWQLILCGGAGILQSGLWQHLGLTPSAADDFVRAIGRAEQSVSATDKALLDAFGATIKLHAGHEPQHSIYRRSSRYSS